MSTVTDFLDRVAEDDALRAKTNEAKGNTDALVSVAGEAGYAFTADAYRAALNDLASRANAFFSKTETDEGLQAKIDGLENWDFAGMQRIVEDAGIQVSPGELRVVASRISANRPEVQAGQELSDADLESVAGGKGAAEQYAVNSGNEAGQGAQDAGWGIVNDANPENWGW